MIKPLPRGRHGLPREYVEQDQRGRLLTAIAASLDEYGYEGTTVSTIGAKARVSKSDFYRYFASKDQCFVAAYESAVGDLRDRVRAACAERADWADGVCTGLEEALGGFEREPARANLLLAEGLRAGPRVYRLYRSAVAGFVPYLRDGAPAPRDSVPPAVADEAVVGGIASLVGRRVRDRETASLPEVFPEVAEFALSPYLGTAEARRIISSR